MRSIFQYYSQNRNQVKGFEKLDENNKTEELNKFKIELCILVMIE